MPEQPKTLRERMAVKAGGKAVIHWMVAAERGPVESGGLNLTGFVPAAPGEPGGPGRFAVACDPEDRVGVRRAQGFAASGETHCVNCPDCIKHPQFAKLYHPGPKVQRYEDIPEDHRRVIEAAEQAEGK